MSAANMKRRMRAPVFLEVRDKKTQEVLRRIGPMVRPKCERVKSAADKALEAGASEEHVIVTAKAGMTSFSGVKR